jgi:small subunit ribosomal protein S21
MSLAEIRLQEGESIESALRRSKRKVQAEDTIKEVKRHSFYLKPGAKRRVKQGSGATACPKKDSERFGLSCNRERRCQVAHVGVLAGRPEEEGCLLRNRIFW